MVKRCLFIGATKKCEKFLALETVNVRFINFMVDILKVVIVSLMNLYLNNVFLAFMALYVHTEITLIEGVHATFVQSNRK